MVSKIIILLWFSIITLASLIPVPKGVSMVSDKIVHFAIYYTTTLLCFLILRVRSLNGLIKISVYIFIYGLIIEFLQHLIPGRNFSVEDIFANTAGIYLFILSYSLLSKDEKE